MVKSVLILGASLMQIPAIKEARKCGYKTFVVDGNENAIGRLLCDCFKAIDLKDKEAILQYAIHLKKVENLKGIFTCGTDFSSSVSYAGEYLGFHCHTYDASLNASIKSLMRQCFQKDLVSSPSFFVFDSNTKDEEFMKLSSFLQYPLVMKPVDNMGGRGTRLINREREIYLYAPVTLSSSRSSTGILEEYMDGKEFSIDALLYKGTLTITGFADRHIFYPPYFIEMGHTMKSEVREEIKKSLLLCFCQGIKALGLTEGACKADIKYTSHGPCIGEIAARLSGGYMSGWTFPYSSGFPLIREALLIASGEKPKELLKRRKRLDYGPSPFTLYEIPSTKYSAERAWISIPGIVHKIEGLKDAKRVWGIKNVFPRDLQEGDEVFFPENNVTKCGNVISLSNSRLRSIRQAEKAVSMITVRLKPFNYDTEVFLSSCTDYPPSAFPSFLEVSNMNIEGSIPEDQDVINHIPEFLLPYINISDRDWSYKTPMDCLRKFNKEHKKHPPLSKDRFYKALLRGGYQAIVYVLDCATDTTHVRTQAYAMDSV